MRLGTIAFLLGIALCQQLQTLPAPAWSWLLPPLAAAALALPRVRPPALVLIGLLWTSLYAHHLLATALPAALQGRDVVIVGDVTSLPERFPHHLRFLVDVRRLTADGRPRPAPARVRLNWYGRAPLLRPGERWRLTVRLKRPHGFMNPGGFDYEGWLFARGIRATGYVRRDGGNRRLDPRRWAHPVDRLRQGAAGFIARAMAARDFGGILTALAVGRRGGITGDQWTVFNATGTTHLMAISGLHIGLVAGLVFAAARRLWAACLLPRRLWPAPKAAAAAAVAGAAAYAALAGFSVPTQRALVMLSVVMGGIVAQRRFAPSAVLAAALGAVLVLDPLAVMDRGLWLSFGAVAVIGYGMGARAGGGGLWWRWGRVHLLVSLGLLPLLLLFFQRSSLTAPLANFIAVPWVSLVVVPVTLGAVALIPLAPAAAAVLLHLAGGAFGLLWPALQWQARHDPGVHLHHAPPAWTLVPALAGLALLLAPRGLPGRRMGAVLVLPLFLAAPPSPAPGAVWVTLLDVGQGLSAVVRTHAHTLVFDTGRRFGPHFDAGGAVVLPYLRAAGLAAVDTLVISHGDADHIGGTRSLLAGIPVHAILTSVPRRLPGPRTQRCRDGQAWDWDGVHLRVLNPPPGGRWRGNDASCVLRVTDAAGRSVLLTGDIEAPAERGLLARRRAALRADALTVPHHGSDTSSTPAFVSAVNPRYALFPVGYANRYGFPRPDVVARYRRRGAALLRTDRDGALTMRLNGAGDLTVTGWRETQGRYWNAR